MYGERLWSVLGRISGVLDQHRLPGSQLTRAFQRGRAHVDGDDTSTDGGGDHDAGQAHAAAAEDRDGLARPYLGVSGQRAERGRETAAQRGRRRERDPRRQRDEVEVSGPHRDEFGERAVIREAGLGSDRAHHTRVLMAGHVGEWHRVVSLPGVPVRTAHAGRLYRYDSSVWRARGNRKRLNPDIATH